MRLYEISPINPTNRSLNKRWFTCREMNLVVGTLQKMPINFKLSFKRHGQIQTLCWDIQHGFYLFIDQLVNSGIEQQRKAGIFKQSDLATMRRDFLVACENIEVGLTDFIYARLMEYPILQSKPRVSHTDHPLMN